MTEANTIVQEDGFTMISAKEQQKRDSIMNELYNDISSSDDEDEEDSTTNSEQTTGGTPASSITTSSSNNSSTTSSSQAGAAAASKKAQSAAGAGGTSSATENADDLANPFKRQVSKQASEALKELYGDDSDDSGQEAKE